jgi:hypothetical protein
VLDGGLSIRAAHRLASERHGYSGGYSSAQRAVARGRAERASAADVGSVAARMLALVSAELSTLERSKGPKDLERLAKLAQTLSQIDRLSPRRGARKAAPALADLLEEQGDGERSEEVRTQLEELDSERSGSVPEAGLTALRAAGFRSSR